MNNLDAKNAGLGLLQSIITRMATNSFYIKAWDLTLFVAVISLKKDISHYGNTLFIALLVSSISFWFLDAYYLQQERTFRKIYNILAEKKYDDPDVNFFRFNLSQYNDVVHSTTLGYTFSLFSKTILLFHIPLITVISFFFAFS